MYEFIRLTVASHFEPVMLMVLQDASNSDMGISFADAVAATANSDAEAELVLSKDAAEVALQTAEAAVSEAQRICTEDSSDVNLQLQGNAHTTHQQATRQHQAASMALTQKQGSTIRQSMEMCKG